MKEMREKYFSIQMTLFPVQEEEKIKFPAKYKEFVDLVEAVKPSRFLILLIVQATRRTAGRRKKA